MLHSRCAMSHDFARRTKAFTGPRCDALVSSYARPAAPGATHCSRGQSWFRPLEPEFTPKWFGSTAEFFGSVFCPCADANVQHVVVGRIPTSIAVMERREFDADTIKNPTLFGIHRGRIAVRRVRLAPHSQLIANPSLSIDLSCQRL